MDVVGHHALLIAHKVAHMDEHQHNNGRGREKSQRHQTREAGRQRKSHWEE